MIHHDEGTILFVLDLDRNGARGRSVLGRHTASTAAQQDVGCDGYRG